MPKTSDTPTVPYSTRRLPTDLHRRLKVVAAQSGSTMEATLNDALHRGLKELERQFKD